jgi:hydroxyacylglutathione hydrolase
VKRIQLGNTVFEGRNDAYVFGVDSGTTALVDTGVATAEGREQLREGLAEYGLSFADVDAVFLTHWHHDHVGLAGEIQAESGAAVYVHEADAPMVESDVAGHEAEIEDRNLFEEWGMPDEKAAQLLEFLELHDDVRGDRPTVETFVDGDRFDLGAVELEVVHLPGHAAGLSGFEFDGTGGEEGSSDRVDGRELLAGDALLPKYTPNVGGADPRVEDPLDTYLDSLGRIIRNDYARVWPGHRDPIDDPAGRAREIVAHHRERTERVLSVLRERGAADAWTVSADLFGELENIHVMHGPGEAWAHLDHLEREGFAEKTEDGYGLTAAGRKLVADESGLAAMFEVGGRTGEISGESGSEVENESDAENGSEVESSTSAGGIQ